MDFIFHDVNNGGEFKRRIQSDSKNVSHAQLNLDRVQTSGDGNQTRVYSDSVIGNKAYFENSNLRSLRAPLNKEHENNIELEYISKPLKKNFEGFPVDRSTSKDTDKVEQSKVDSATTKAEQFLFDDIGSSRSQTRSSSPIKPSSSSKSNVLDQIISDYNISKSSTDLASADFASNKWSNDTSKVDGFKKHLNLNQNGIPTSPNNQDLAMSSGKKGHSRNGSGASLGSNTSSNSYATNTGISKGQRFVRYAMDIQSSSAESNPSIKWQMPNVLKWLDTYGFNNTWKETFRRNEISGNRFLELCNYDSESTVWKQFKRFLDTNDEINSVERFIELLSTQNLESIADDETNKNNDAGSKNHSRQGSTESQVSGSHNRADKRKSNIYKHLSSFLGSTPYGHSTTPSAQQSASYGANNNAYPYKQRPVSSVDLSTVRHPNWDSKPLHKFFRKNRSTGAADFFPRDSSLPIQAQYVDSSNSSGFNQQGLPKYSLKDEALTRESSSPSNISEKLDPAYAGTNRKSGFFTNLRKYGADKGPEALKQPQNTSYPSSFAGVNGALKSNRNTSFANTFQDLKGPISSVTKSKHLGDAPTLRNALEDKTSLDLSNNVTSDWDSSANSLIERIDLLDIKSKDSTYRSMNQGFGETIDSAFLPKSSSDSLRTRVFLLTRDNQLYVPIILDELDIESVALFKEKAMARLNLVPVGNFSFHLTDFGANEGEALSDDVLQIVLKSNQHSKLLVRQDSLKLARTDSSTSLDSKSFEVASESNDHKTYPSTPRYLLQARKDSKEDYWTFKGPLNMNSFSDSDDNLKERLAAKDFQSVESFPHDLSNISFESSNGHDDVISMARNDRVDEAKNYSENNKALNENANLKNGVMKPSRESDVSSMHSNRTSDVDFSVASIPSNEEKERSGSIVAKRAAPPPPLTKTSFSRKNSLLKRKILETSVPQYRARTNSVAKDRKPIGARVPSKSISSVASSSGSDNKNEGPALYNKTKNSYNSYGNNSKTSNNYNNNNNSNKNSSKNNAIGNANDKDGEDDDDDDDDDSFFFKPMGPLTETSAEGNQNRGFNEGTENDFFVKPIRNKPAERENSKRPLLRINVSPMNVRPPVDEVYKNLEKYFPDTDLDKPIIDDSITSPSQDHPMTDSNNSNGSSLRPNISRTFSNANISPGNPLVDDSDEIIGVDPDPESSFKRIKTIRVVANEARRKRLEKQSSHMNAHSEPQLLKFAKPEKGLERTNTKLWGQKVVEVTSKEIEKGIVSKLRHGKLREFKEFVWIKGELIGRGSFGSVYLALNVTTGEMLAVKQVVVGNYPNNSSGSKNEGIDALHKEVETMKDLDHVNIVRYLGFEQKKNIYSLFLEYVAGGSVSSCIKSYGRFDEQLIRFITRQVLLGLEYLHSNKILHRDLKADNLLLEIDGTCKISDFGISKKSKDIYVNNAEMSMQGSIFWMAPEVIDSIVEDKKKGYSAKIDIWSLGCVVLEMFAGKRPWSNEAVVSAIYKIGKTKLAPPIPEDISKLISPEAIDFIQKCFTINPEERPTAKNLLDHPFISQNTDFAFERTKLAEIIKFNSKKYNV